MNKKIQGVLLIVAFCTEASLAQQNPAAFTVQTARQSAVDAPVATATSSTSPTATVPPVYHDSLGRTVVGTSGATYGLRYDGSNPNVNEMVDEFGNRTRIAVNSAGRPLELKHEFQGRPVWNERMAYDASGGLLLADADSGVSTLPSKAAQYGIKVGFPDWVQVRFAQSATINQVDVITRQDNCWVTGGIKPLRVSDTGGPTRFATSGPGAGLGITDYEVQYLDSSSKWIMIPGTYVTKTTEVAKSFVFAPITTTSIRLVIKGGGGGSSRVVEIEAFEKTAHRNVALASQGGSATASSVETGGGAVVGAVIDGDETGKYWGAGGGWKDATPDAPPPAATVTTINEYGGYTRTNFSNQFAGVSRLVNNNPPPTTPPKLGMPFVMERADVTYSGGKSFSATAAITNWGIEYWDSTGGSRIQYYDANKRLFYVTDWTDGHGTQPVVRINRDAQGRPTDVYLGKDIGLLQFVYGDFGWAYTRLIDLTTNLTRFNITRRETPATPIAYPELLHLTNGYMPKYGPILEWHNAISPVPNIVASLKEMPYALLPTTQTGFVKPARWVITPFATDEEAMTNIRVEYDAENIYLHVPTLNAGPLTVGQDIQAFRFSRNSASQASAKRSDFTESQSVSTPLYYGQLCAEIQRMRSTAIPHQTFTLATFGLLAPTERYMKGQGAGGSGGGADGIEAENDTLPSADFWGDSINVSGKGDPPFFPFHIYPPRPAPPPEPPIGPSSNNPTAPCASAPPGVYLPECQPIDPKSWEGELASWAQGVAQQAMWNDKKCRDFMHNPSKGLIAAGYLGNTNLNPGLVANFDNLWNSLQFMYGDLNGPACANGNPAYVFDDHGAVLQICSDNFMLMAYQTPKILPIVMLHEFLHVLGLCENGDCTPNVGITNAVQAACGAAVNTALQSNPPPPAH